ncbi:hypothetical protein E2C01_005034 [Portunus trituberculatus]|uniref:Endonuclease/exonuclease/phosphatase domain-containing protein n=1 Tax=Portunus trituberculatus TaxID=210409 RepID=A0A5B7CVJ3_PORTR|nr:hypothetical protein [Portunus trituberculatus]
MRIQDLLHSKDSRNLTRHSHPSEKHRPLHLHRGAFCGDGIDILAVSLTLQNTHLDVYNIYNPTRGNLNIEEVFAHAAVTPTYIGGDFNCHHPLLNSCTTTNADGRHLPRALHESPEVRLLNNREATHL